MTSLILPSPASLLLVEGRLPAVNLLRPLLHLFQLQPGQAQDVHEVVLRRPPPLFERLLPAALFGRLLSLLPALSGRRGDGALRRAAFNLLARAAARARDALAAALLRCDLADAAPP